MKRDLIGRLVPLMIGGAIYILFRTASLRMFGWFEVVGLTTFIDDLRATTYHFSYNIPEWVLYSLPDGLWIFSYVGVVLYIWKNSVSFDNLFWITIIPLLAIGSEIGQLLGIVIGTFDVVDLLLYTVGAISPFLFFTNHLNNNPKLLFQWKKSYDT